MHTHSHTHTTHLAVVTVMNKLTNERPKVAKYYDKVKLHYISIHMICILTVGSFSANK